MCQEHFYDSADGGYSAGALLIGAHSFCHPWFHDEAFHDEVLHDDVFHDGGFHDEAFHDEEFHDEEFHYLA